MASTEVELVNQALRELGERRITSLADDAETARVANDVYEHTRDEVTSMHPWNCAVKRANLAQLSADPNHGFDHAFQLPSDFMRMAKPQARRNPYQIEGGKLLTNDEDVDLIYIRKIENVADMDLQLQRAIIARLKWRLAAAFTKSQQVAAQALNEFQRAIAEARFDDSIQAPVDQFAGSTLLDARRSGGHSSDIFRTEDDD